MINLVINARDAMPDGGGVMVDARRQEVDTAPAGMPDLGPGAHVVVTVVATGTGMDAETRARIFEPFFTTKAPGRGTGLGLATVYGIVTQYGRPVSVASEPGCGAVFSVWLPLSSRDVAEGATPRRAATPARRQTVLVVEDEEGCAFGGPRLRQAGYAVLEAADGAEGLRVASSHAGLIDLLLTDIVMPGDDGYTVARQLRDTRPGLAVASMSGYADPALHDASPDADDGALIRKPFTPEALLAHLAQILRQEGPALYAPPPG